MYFSVFSDVSVTPAFFLFLRRDVDGVRRNGNVTYFIRSIKPCLQRRFLIFIRRPPPSACTQSGFGVGVREKLLIFGELVCASYTLFIVIRDV